MNRDEGNVKRRCSTKIPVTGIDPIAAIHCLCNTSAVKFAIIMAVAMCIGGCSSLDERKHVEIMDDIESKVQLPPRAQPLKYYARAYKYASSTRVAAVYFRPFDDEDLWFCESAKSYGADNGQILLGCPPPHGMNRN